MSEHLAGNTPMVYYARPDSDVLALRFAGEWVMSREDIPPTRRLLSLVKREDKALPAKKLRLELGQVEKWDSSLLVVLYELMRHCKVGEIECEWHEAPHGILELINLAASRTPHADAKGEDKPTPQLEKLGSLALKARAATNRVLDFIGEVTLSILRLPKGKAYFRKSDLFEVLAESGPKALPIVTLISFLVGLILAFVGSMQLQEFGAQIFVANLVGVAMAREMGAMMTAIIMAGRTGASYAARLGTMQANEEVDALQTTGIEPIDFLVLPRVLAMLIMMPFLCLYADAIGILGGMAIGVFMLDLAPVEYWHQTVDAVSMHDFWAGLIKSVVFALVVALAGCYHGIRCGRSSAAVGKVTTAAVVSAIVFIILTDSVLTVIYDILKF